MTRAKRISRMFLEDSRTWSRNGKSLKRVCWDFSEKQWLQGPDVEFVYQFRDGSRIVSGMSEWRIE